MVEPVETAREHIHAAHEAHGDTDRWPRWMAVVVSFLAAGLALADLGAKSSQTSYLTQTINAANTVNAFRAKDARADLWNAQASLMESLPDAADPAVQARIKAARAAAAQMLDAPEAGDGVKQLRAKSQREDSERQVAARAYHVFEETAGALEISIVLASVSVITRVRALGFAAGIIGVAACCYGLTVFA